MATNLEYLEQKLAESKAQASAYRKQRDETKAKMDAVSQEIKSLQSYLATLKPVLNAGKIKDTKAKIEALNTELAKLTEQYKFYVAQVQKQDENSAKLQSQIDTFINAISSGVEKGMTTEEALEYANNQTDLAVTRLQAEEQANAQNEASKKARNMTFLIIGVIVAVIVTVLIVYFVRKKRNKGK